MEFPGRYDKSFTLHFPPILLWYSVHYILLYWFLILNYILCTTQNVTCELTIFAIELTIIIIHHLLTGDLFVLYKCSWKLQATCSGIAKGAYAFSWSVTRYLVRVHNWSGQTKYDDINGPPGPFMLSWMVPPDCLCLDHLCCDRSLCDVYCIV